MGRPAGCVGACQYLDFRRQAWMLAAHEYPREIAFVPELPMTATGKIMRRKLRQQQTANHD